MYSTRVWINTISDWKVEDFLVVNLHSEMEDRHVTLQEITPGVFYSAVFDGHGGAKVAEFAQVRNLMMRLIIATKPLIPLI